MMVYVLQILYGYSKVKGYLSVVRVAGCSGLEQTPDKSSEK